MTIKVAAFCSYLTTVDSQWRSSDYDASNMVKAVKGRQLHGRHSDIPTGLGAVRLTEQNKDEAFRIFGTWGAAQLNSEIPDGALALVPIPSSTSLVGSQEPYVALRLAHELAAATGHRAQVFDTFRWQRQFPPSHQGGVRDANTLAGNLSEILQLPQGVTPVLVDDVMTKGGHLLAADKKLRDRGHRCRLALVVGRTVLSPPPSPFEGIIERIDELESEVPAYRNYLVSVNRVGVRGHAHHGFASLWMPHERRGDFTGMVNRCREVHNYRDEIIWGSIGDDQAAFYVELVESFFADNRFMLHQIVTAQPAGIPVDAWKSDTHLERCFQMLLLQKMRFFASGREPEAFHYRICLPDDLPGAGTWLGRIQEGLQAQAVASVLDRRWLGNPFAQTADAMMTAVLADWEGWPLNPGQVAFRDAIVRGLGWEQWGDLRGDTYMNTWKYNIWTYHNPVIEAVRAIVSRPVKHYEPYRAERFRGSR